MSSRTLIVDKELKSVTPHSSCGKHEKQNNAAFLGFDCVHETAVLVTLIKQLFSFGQSFVKEIIMQYFGWMDNLHVLS